MKKSLLDEFRNPGCAYRGKPFWAWNGALEPDELRRQIRHMKQMGLGGFFMHSRVGLDTPYLSDEWFDCVDACIDEAEKQDMEAWLYDEDRWPSGAGGGLVTKNPKYRSRRLHVQQHDKPSDFKWTKDTVAAFAARIDGSTARDVRKLSKGKSVKLKEAESIVSFTSKTLPESDWFNGQTYLDTLNHEAVREFIRVTHEAYRKNFGKHFGKRVPGMFTDEPNHEHMLGGGRPAELYESTMTWTEKLPAVFKKRYGYDLIPQLMSLVFDIEGMEASQPRYHYHDCTTFLFVDAFARQIGDWCEKHNLEHTGHVLMEETLSSQTNVVGSSMRFYEYMQAPGMDLLTERSREYDTAKAVSSVAHQFGRKWRLTETYGCTGWDFGFAGHKALGDWQVALGINLRCQHLSWYTMRGQAKRDYPAGIFYQSPWWDSYAHVEDYFARVQLVMTQGEEVRDLLVLHPVESMWLKCRRDWKQDPDVPKMDKTLQCLRDTFLKANIDFDYGEEEILSRHGSVGKKAGEPTIKVNKAAYRAVVVPPMLTIRSSTLALLEKFHEAGGQIVFAGSPPSLLDAVPSDRPAQLAKKCTRTSAKGAKLAASVESTCRRLSIADSKGQEIDPTLYLLREDRDAFYLFLCNTGHNWKLGERMEPRVVDRTLGCDDVRIRGFSECKGMPVELDPSTGDRSLADARQTKGEWEIRTNLPPLASRLFILPKEKGKAHAPPMKKLKTTDRKPVGGAKWTIQRSEPNVLVLDRAAYRLGDGKWRHPEEILRLDLAIRTELDIPLRDGQMVQPWARERSKSPKRTPFGLKYNFAVRHMPTTPLAFAIEDPHLYQIEINGNPLDADAENGWWVDRSLRTLTVDPAFLRVGANEVVVTGLYDENHPGFEIVYLLGEFGIRLKGVDATLIKQPEALTLGDWCKQGMPFYSGHVTYRTTLKNAPRKGSRVVVQVPEFDGVAVRVLVDGQDAGCIGWPGQEVEITSMLKKTPLELSFEVLGHRRNSHGPFHLSEKWPRWTGPGQYVTSGDSWIETHQLVPCGLKKRPILVTRQ